MTSNVHGTSHLRLLFIMDPIERILPDKDTTFAFMLEALGRGHEVFHCGVLDLFATGSLPHGRARRVEVHRAEPHYTLYEERIEELIWFDAVFMRKDPPVDSAYLFATHLLSLVDVNRTLVLNRPSGLRDANEKLYALNFPEVIPPTLVTADRARLRRFMEDQDGEMIVKPLDGCGGAGVFHVHRSDRNLNAILETATADGNRLIMAQRYIPEVRIGDKRIILLDGEPLGAVLRVPREDEHRGNIHVGGIVRQAALADADARIIGALAPRLRADGLYFVGLDVIGPYLTEVNVTSPTGIQEIDRFNGTNLAARMLEFTEARVPRAL
jgi:glutathione synthase